MRAIFKTANIQRILLGAFLAVSAIFSIYNFVYAERMLPRVSVGPVHIGNLTQKDAQAKLQDASDNFKKEGINITVEGEEGGIDPANIDFFVDAEALAEKSFLVGRGGPWYFQLQDIALSPFIRRTVPAEIK